MPLDADILGEGIAGLVRAHVAQSLAPLLKRIAELEAREIPTVPDFDDERAAMSELVCEQVERAVAAIPKPKDGESVNVAALFAEIAAAVDRAVAALPKPKDGSDADPEVMRAMVAEAVGKIPVPKDGESVTLDQVRPLVAEAVDAIPVPKSVTVDDIRPLLEQLVAALPKAKDADPVDYEFVTNQLAIMVNAKMAELPRPKDGESVAIEDVRPMLRELVAALPRAKDGESVHPDTVRVMVTDAVNAAVAALPAPKDGEPGKNADPLVLAASVHDEIARQFDALRPHIKGAPGEPGLGFDDISGAIEEGGRRLRVVFSRGEQTKEIVGNLDTPLYRGTFKSGQTAQAGDCVTYGGTLWIALKDTTESPGKSGDWRMAVKSGMPT